jgi:hypothetical protein
MYCALAKQNIEAQSAELMKTEKLTEPFAAAKARKKCLSDDNIHKSLI